jgi:diguanylate cyclase (GGDEF)-like protein
MVFSESCGCFENLLAELPRVKRMYYANSRQQEKFYDQQDRLTADLFRTDNKNILETVEKHYQIFGNGNLYIYANDYYFKYYVSQENAELENIPVSDSYVLVACGGRNVERQEENAYMRIARRDLTDAPLLRDERLTIFYSLHFKNINMGFLVLTQPPTVAEMHLHENIVNLCVFAIENARQKIRSERLNRKLNALYMKDQLTGLYNRFGYDKMAETVFQDINGRGSDVHVLFLDIDDMKGINDRYGHEQGDLAIRTVSSVMKGSCRKSDFKMRYGGDEFVIITEAGKADLKGRLIENFRKVNESGELPFYLSVSIGDYTVSDSNPKSLDDLLRAADALMYQEKRRKKQKISGLAQS